MQISEPTTMLTDFLLAGIAIFFNIKLFKKGAKENQQSITFWGWMMLMLSLGAIVGGTSHGFILHLNENTHFMLWKATLFSIGLTIFFMLAATIINTIHVPLRSWLLLIPGVQLIIYSFWMTTHDDFIYVIINYSPALISVIALQAYAFFKFKAKAALWLISGMMVSIIAAGIQASGVTLYVHFNHNDLYHVIQMVGLFLTYKGALQGQDR